jgi:hypothetical protein
MELIQILLPLRDNRGRKFDRALTQKFTTQLIKPLLDRLHPLAGARPVAYPRRAKTRRYDHCGSYGKDVPKTMVEEIPAQSRKKISARRNCHPGATYHSGLGGRAAAKARAVLFKNSMQDKRRPADTPIEKRLDDLRAKSSRLGSPIGNPSLKTTPYRTRHRGCRNYERPGRLPGARQAHGRPYLRISGSDAHSLYIGVGRIFHGG